MNISGRILDVCTAIPGFLGLWNKLDVGSLPRRVRYGAWSRPHYAYGVFMAADLARRLGHDAISVIELGVAGGNGLVALEEISRRVGVHFGIEITVFGFDAGSGMPDPVDYRDLPHVWGEGFYAMDEAALRKRLTKAQLLVGNVRETIPHFMSGDVPPIGFVAFDLDYYSSTKAAFRLFDGAATTRLPRVYCYMDDIIWPEYACHNEYVGELLAIREFNAEHDALKLSQLHLLRHMRPRYFPWNDQMYVLHDFLHPEYATNITQSGTAFREIPLR
jgi:hypothetical protein